MLRAAATGTLAELGPLEWSSDAAVTVVIAAAGYPRSPRTGDPISGLEVAAKVADAYVLHAGTVLRDGQVCSAGGRVLSIVGTGRTLAAARNAAYDAVACIQLDGCHYRHDIADVAAG